MQTIGSVIDQLIVVNLKIWHSIEIQENVSSVEDVERLDAADRIISANRQRNFLIDELDRMINLSIKNGKSEVFEKLKM